MDFSTTVAVLLRFYFMTILKVLFISEIENVAVSPVAQHNSNIMAGGPAVQS
jgi:hypothetical protein